MSAAPIDGPADPIPQTPTGDVCYDLGNGVGQTAISFQPCQIGTAELPVVAVDEPPVPCQEDEACWDCSTMGNLICGPGAVGSLTTAEVHALPITGTTSAPMVGTASALLIVGVLLARVARRLA